jgi:hypothetical protein
MSPLDVLCEPVWQRLTWTLLHFLWQGLALAAILVTALWLFRVRRARARYALSLLAMRVMAACPLLTFSILETEIGWSGAEAHLRSGLFLRIARIGCKNASHVQDES